LLLLVAVVVLRGQPAEEQVAVQLLLLLEALLRCQISVLGATIAVLPVVQAVQDGMEMAQMARVAQILEVNHQQMDFSGVLLGRVLLPGQEQMTSVASAGVVEVNGARKVLAVVAEVILGVMAATAIQLAAAQDRLIMVLISLTPVEFELATDKL
jgi:hypothetical protein